jgi:hypothetical protein
VVGYSLDEACQHFPGVRLRTQVIAFQDSPKIRWRLSFGSRWILLKQFPAACDQSSTAQKNSRKHLVFGPLSS